MNRRDEILARFTGTGSGAPLYLPDLTAWYEWHRGRGTLPEPWQEWSLPEIAHDLALPIWLTVQPWRLETTGLDVSLQEAGGERILRADTPHGPLQARWQQGDDGDWWQVEYPVKDAGDLPAALALAEARSYALDGAGLARARALVGEDGVLALELPRRALSDLLHEFLGWGEGLLLLDHILVQQMLIILEGKLQLLVQEICQLDGHIVLSPDNLDGQFVSPRLFDRHLADSYRLTTRMLHRYDKVLVVHAGGPVSRLLAPLAAAGVDGVQGIAGPPQGNTTLAEARALAGPAMTLWGGIPQDYLLDVHREEALAAAVRQAAAEATGDGRALLGVADRVPPEADLARVTMISTLLGKT
ncbi:MAG: hypothetical protein P8129_16110 [Anaerolineae bacterium]